VVPVLFFFVYWLVVRAIARVANDRHGCEGSTFRSIGWAMTWATAYVLPLGAVIWVTHLVLAARMARGG
jgi:hypothetical protein